MCEPVSLISGAISGAQQIAASNAEDAAVDARNNAKRQNYYRQQREYEVQANLDNVQYLNDVQEQDHQQDVTYQALLDQWSSDDMQLQKIFASNDHAIEDAMIKMHKGDYAGSMTGRTAARLAGDSVREMGMAKSRALHNKMMASKETTMIKEQRATQAASDSRSLFMDVAFAPVHGMRPAAPALESKPSKAGLILGLAGTGLNTYMAGKANQATDVWSEKQTVEMDRYG